MRLLMPVPSHGTIACSHAARTSPVGTASAAVVNVLYFSQPAVANAPFVYAGAVTGDVSLVGSPCWGGLAAWIWRLLGSTLPPLGLMLAIAARAYPKVTHATGSPAI